MTNKPRLIRIASPTISSNQGWTPVQGDAFTQLLERNSHLSSKEKQKFVEETVSILSECVPPNADSPVTNTGLIIGHVQSGKTFSFTGLATLARDNNFPLIVLLAGTKTPLVQQSEKRLRHDLCVDEAREWSIFSSADNAFQKNEAELVQNEIKKWRKKSPRARTVVIVLMKEHTHLEKFRKHICRYDCSDIPTLIIDDEADQAGMNIKAKQDEESTTYAKIKQFRKLFPHHSYLLYTATPQAPLLISRVDTLSPDFGRVLTPGDGYIGGREFFIEGKNDYVRYISESDLSKEDSAPGSFKNALRDFFIGVAIGLLEGGFRKNQNRSMMIHAAVKTGYHRMFARWAKEHKGQWLSILEDRNHYGYQSLIDDFEKNAEDLLKTYSTDFTVDDILCELPNAIEETSIMEFNASQSDRIVQPVWQRAYSWILSGGVGLDRGFTVEGLTVSYMPRSVGVGNIDSLQQRARFFGYKKRYLGLCRIYLPTESINAFTDYVQHEEDIHSSIRENLEQKKSLKDWRRTYLLDASYKPTRAPVILLKMNPFKRKQGWVVPDYPFENEEFISSNRQIIEEILDRFSDSFRFYCPENWTESQQIPQYSDCITLADIIPYIGLFRYQSYKDSCKHQALILMLRRLVLDKPNMLCSFYAFSYLLLSGASKRTLSDAKSPTIKSLFQGANKPSYPGARKILSPDGNITFQLHRYDIYTAENKRQADDVPVLATHVPDNVILSYPNETIWQEVG